MNFYEDNIEMYCWDWELPENAPKLSYMYRNEEDGLNLFGAISENDTLCLNSLYLKYPVLKGDSWEFQNIGWGGYFIVGIEFYFGG